MRATVTPQGVFTFGEKALRAALGYGGVRIDKREGDGATPAGLLPLRRVLYRADRMDRPDCAVSVTPVTPLDGWCDDPTHASYNRPVQLPFTARAEALWREDAIYDIIGVLGWNDAPVQPHLGSAIFLHLARPTYTPTEGCVALALDDLRQVLSMGLTEILITPPPAQIAPPWPDTAAPAGTP